jgi:Dyp-type peroxidase family
MSMSDPADPLLDGEDIQGNVIPGFNRAQEVLAAFTVNDADDLRRALAGLPALASMKDVMRQRKVQKASLAAGMGRPATGEFWTNLALSARAADLLGADVRALDAAFGVGMRAGDPSAATLTSGEPNPYHRDHWRVGAPARPCDVLLIFAHDTDAAALAAPVIAAFAEALGSAPNYVEAGVLLPGEIEHFGFRDGISQIGVIGKVTVDGVERDITTRYGVPSLNGQQFGKPGQKLVWPGQILTGQPRYAGEQVAVGVGLENGSFLVFRRLEQDVRAFFDDTDAMAAALVAAGAPALTGAALRERIVGRDSGGQPLMRDDTANGKPEGDLAINHFGYANDTPALTLADGTQVPGGHGDPEPIRGLRCPAWAHVRKVNPRDLPTDQLGPDETLAFQMLRRGIPFGPLYDHARPEAPVNVESRGLLFLSYQRHFDQFSTLARDWMNQKDAPGPGGFDLLVGQTLSDGLHAPKQATFHAAGQAGIAFEAPRQWVLPTGGAFLFAPSLTFLKVFA